MKPSSSRRRKLAVAAFAWTCVAGACTFGASPSGYVPPAQPPGPHLLYVAVGASETVGVGSDDPLVEAWPQVFYRTALPASATFVNVGVPGATVAEALQTQLPQALALRPNLVTVWLNVNDIIAGVQPHTYGRQLAGLLSALRRGGATRVLVANTPPLNDLPLYLSCRPYAPTGSGCDSSRLAPTPEQFERTVAAFNREIARDAQEAGAQVVDLYAVAVSAERARTFDRLISGDGFHPSDAGHRAVARAFARAYQAH